MTESTDASNASAPPRSSSPAAELWAAWTCWRLLPGTARGALLPLLRFVAAVRAVADHPALTLERKEAALASLAAPFAEAGASVQAEGRWSESALALAEALALRGLDSRAPWQILQAAGQDLRKTRYRDWSDLLTWSRFAAAAPAALAFRLLGADAEAARKAEALGIALQLVEIVRLAPSHHAWLARVYLPERWFAEARCDVGDLGFARISDPLRAVTGRALDQAGALLDEGAAAVSGLSGLRLRMAFHAMMIETRGEIAALRRQAIWQTARPSPRPWTRRMVTARAALAALRAR